MDIVAPQYDDRPAICPICGSTASNGVRRRNEMGVSTLHYSDNAGHLFSVTWLEVA